MSTLRLATRDDNAALLELFQGRPMEGDVVLLTRRDPDFFGLYAMQRGTAECWIFESHGGIAGFGAVHMREGWLAGRVARVGYLGDLRFDFGASRARTLERDYAGVIEHARSVHGVEAFYTAVLASNVAALRALVQRSPERSAQPRYHFLRRFDMVSIQFAGRRRSRPPACDVRTAVAADVSTIVSLLDRDHRARPFGYRFDDGEWEHRLARWPSLDLARTYLAFDHSGRLVGVTSVWNPASVKRYRVLDYRGGMRWTRRLYNPAARMMGWAPLPSPGQDFRYFYLVNTSIEGDDPEVFRALLEHIYQDHRGRGEHFFSICEYENDPLAPALRGFIARRLSFHLYTVTPADAPAPDVGPGRPGFEMALA